MIGKAILVTPELTHTGAPNSTMYMACALQKIGYYPIIYTMVQGGLDREIDKRGIPIKQFCTPNDFCHENFGENDICFVNTSMLAECAIVLQKMLPTILIIREGKCILEFHKIFGTNWEKILEVKNVYCVSEYASQELFKIIGVKPKVIRNYTPDVFQSNQFQKDNILRFGIIGTFEKRKGVDICLDAFLEISKNRKDVELHIVGRTLDWEKEFWKPQIERINNHANIIYHGEITSREEMNSIYKLLNVVIVASLDESCSLVALEAASMRKYLIISRNVGAKYLVTKFNGKLFDTGNALDLQKAMESAIKNRKLINFGGYISRWMYLRKGSESNYLKNIKKEIKSMKSI